MFRLALQLGCTVEELGERMTCSEFAEWAVLYAHDPFGDMRADLRTAQLCALFYNAHRGRDSKALGVSDFMLFRPFEEAQTQAESDSAAGARLMAQLRTVQAQQQARG